MFDAIIQGVVQGLTEFLPVSSSGHLVLLQHILGVSEHNLFFDVMLHVGTLFAVIAFYFKKILKLLKAFFGVIRDMIKGRLKLNKLHGDKNFVVMIIIGLLPLFLLFLPVAPGAMDIKDFAEFLSGGNYIIVPGIFILITSFLLNIGIKLNEKNVKNEIEKKSGKVLEPNKKNYISPYDALCIGFAQFLAAIFPGLSRSGTTLSVALMRGINRQTALDYSFILGTPAIFAAAILEFKEASESGAIHAIDMPIVLVGMIVSAVVGFLSIKLFKLLLTEDKMSIFVTYTLIVGSVTVLIGLIEIIMGVNLFTGVQL